VGPSKIKIMGIGHGKFAFMRRENIFPPKQSSLSEGLGNDIAKAQKQTYLRRY